MEKEQMIFYMGVLKGMCASTDDGDAKGALETSIGIIGQLIQGYQLVKPEAPTEEKETNEVDEIIEE